MSESYQNGSNKIRVITVDDHEMVRQGMDFLFLPYEDIEVVGAAHDGQEALRLCEELKSRCDLDGYGHAGYGWGGCDAGGPPTVPSGTGSGSDQLLR